MKRRRIWALAILFAMAALACQSIVWGDEPSTRPSGPTAASELTAPSSWTQVMADDVPSGPPPREALMTGMDKIGAGSFLDKAGISLYGYIEAGYFYDFTVPKDITPAKTPPSDAIYFPGPYKNAPMLNQLNLSIERAIDPTKGKFDAGFKVELMYGRDAFFTHSNGVLDQGNKGGGTGPFDQLDLLQAYVKVCLPIGSGVTIQAGKFITPFGYETIEPINNQFYTHSYQFGYAEPSTQTGVLAGYNFSDTLSMTAGFTRGWNQTLYDDNGAIDFLGSAAWAPNSTWNFSGNLSVGPQALDDNSHYWIVGEAIANYYPSQSLSFGLDAIYGLANSYGQWWGLAGYAGYKINPQFTANARLEYYHDGNGFTTGSFPSDVDFFELTLGTGITPMPNTPFVHTLTIRPELRLDVSNHSVLDLTKFTQLTFACDAYWKF